MKKLLIFIPIATAALVLAGCSKDADSKFADHAPGARSAVQLTTYTPQKGGIPMPKPTTQMPAVLH